MRIYLKRITVFICAFALFSMILFPLVDSLTKANIAKANPAVSFAGSTFKVNKTSVKPSKTIKAEAKIKADGEKTPGVIVELSAIQTLNTSKHGICEYRLKIQQKFRNKSSNFLKKEAKIHEIRERIG